MHKHYASHLITNNGEVLIDTAIKSSIPYDKELWHIFHDIVIGRHISQKMGQCDFIFINKRGILVLEVKGGKIAYSKGRYVQLPDAFNRTEKVINPFNQARENAASLQQYLKENGINDCFVTSAVAFPQSQWQLQGMAMENVYSLSTSWNLRDFLVNVLEQSRYNVIESLKKRQAENSAYYETIFPELSNDKMDRLAALIEPRVNIAGEDISAKKNREEAHRRAADNIRILEGLRENRRIMIQGPAGSGKSKYAFELIKQKIENEHAQGLYFCWNEFLAVEMNARFLEEGLSENVKAEPLYGYIQKLIKQAALPADTLNFENITCTRQALETALSTLAKNKEMPHLDFLVFDEAQDMFDKGIDLLLDNCLASGEKGIENGEYLIFFDELQAFSSGINQEFYDMTLMYLKHHCAIYRMTDSFRTTCLQGLQEFLLDLDVGVPDFKRKYGRDIQISTYDKVEKLPGLLLSTLTNLKKSCNLSADECIVLFSSNLVSGNNNKDKPLDGLLPPEKFLKLNNINITQPSNKIKYTTCLKFKGLDRSAVIVVVNDLYNQKIQTLHQLYIGVTRAKAKLYIMVDKVSVDLIKELS